MNIAGREETAPAGLANPAVIDLLACDAARNEVLLVMTESRPWQGGDTQLHELQEKLNAYASFILDGEMLAEHPELAGKLTRIELRCVYYPSERALALLEVIHDRLELQEIALTVVAPSSEGTAADCRCG